MGAGPGRGRRQIAGSPRRGAPAYVDARNLPSTALAGAGGDGGARKRRALQRALCARMCARCRASRALPAPAPPQGMVESRRCRDVLFLLLFAAYLGGMFVAAGIAFQEGA